MIDQAALNFLVKLSLSCLLLALAIVGNVDCRAVQNEQYNGDIQEVHGTGQVYQYQPQPQQSSYNVQPAAVSSPANYQYYDQQQQQPSAQQYPTYETNADSSSTTNNKPHRRSILSSLMAPFYSMRDQGMAMLSASLQGCNPDRFSLWCRFWSMIMRR